MYCLNSFTTKVASPQRNSYVITVKYNIDLARAKSEAPNNTYSLLKQNVKSCNAKRRRQRER